MLLEDLKGAETELYFFFIPFMWPKLVKCCGYRIGQICYASGEGCCLVWIEDLYPSVWHPNEIKDISKYVLSVFLGFRGIAYLSPILVFGSR